MIRIGLVGFGHWGPKLARCVTASDGLTLAALCDISSERLAVAALAHPGTRLTADWREIVADPAIDAVILATPAATHAALGLAVLKAGRHVLVEKPLARSRAGAVALIDEANRRGLVLMVDHTLVFSPAIRRIADLLGSGALGRVRHLHTVRVGPGIVRDDVNVMWDLAVHDLTILGYLMPSRPLGIQARASASMPGSREDVADLTVLYPDNLPATIQVSWRAPVKLRRMVIAGSRRTLAYDDLDPRAQIRLYDPDHEPDFAADATGGEIVAPLSGIEPLRAVVENFRACIAGGGSAISDGAAALHVIRLLEAADRSVALGGHMVPVDRQGALVA